MLKTHSSCKTRRNGILFWNNCAILWFRKDNKEPHAQPDFKCQIHCAEMVWARQLLTITPGYEWVFLSPVAPRKLLLLLRDNPPSNQILHKLFVTVETRLGSASWSRTHQQYPSQGRPRLESRIVCLTLGPPCRTISEVCLSRPHQCLYLTGPGLWWNLRSPTAPLHSSPLCCPPSNKSERSSYTLYLLWSETEFSCLLF